MIEERKIIIALITSTEYIQQIKDYWTIQLFESKTAKKIALWVMEYYDKYKKAPGKDFEAIYYRKKENGNGLPKDLVEEMEETLLPGLSEEYENETVNVDYLVDITKAYFNERHIRKHAEEVISLLDAGKSLEAEKLTGEFKPIAKDANSWLDLNSENIKEKLHKAFNRSREGLIRFPGAIGEFLNDQLVRGAFVALMAPEKRGKCLTGNQKVLMSTGEELTINDLFLQKRRDIISFDEETQTFVKTKISDFWKNGVKKVYQVTTKTGRRVQVTSNHPFLTPNGWEDLIDLKKGDFIAVPKKVAYFGRRNLSDIKIKLLAYFIAEGCLAEYNYDNGNGTHKTCLFTNAEAEIQKDFTACVETMGCKVNWNGIQGYVFNSENNKWKHGKNHVLNMLTQFDLNGKLSYHKHIPKIIFTLPKNKIALFLKILYTCDGWINVDGNEIGFGVANEILARQVQTLLTKFGIVSGIAFKSNNKAGAWSVTIRDLENIVLFCNEIGFVFEKQVKAKKAIKGKEIIYKSFLDKFPYQIAEKFYNAVKNELGGGYRIEAGKNSEKSHFHKKFTKAGTTAYQIKKKTPIMRQSFIEIKDTDAGKLYFNSPILWDEIVEILYIGKMETYDVTVEKHHNFIAENIIVHNSFWLLEFGMRAIKNKKRVAFFQAGDMDEDDQLVRISCYLTGKAELLSSAGVMFQPVKDCTLNQTDSCDKKERTCSFGLFDKMEAVKIRKTITLKELMEARKDNKDYIPCTACDKYDKNKWGTVYVEKIDTGEPISEEEAVEAFEEYFTKHKKEFRLSTHSNGTLSVKDIDDILGIWEQEGFIPDVILIDYADLLVDQSQKEERHRQNKIWKDLRGLNQKRKCLLITATQTDANSYNNDLLTLDNYSEDKRKYGHCSAMYGLNQDHSWREKELGIMRLNEIIMRKGNFSSLNQVHVLQNLAIGRPVLGSYW
jgi:intein/homing endonuclease